MGSPERVALVGPLNMDLFLRGSAPLDREALDAWVGPCQFDLLVAGSIGYTTQAFARLGDEVELHSTIGSDAFGTHIRQELSDAGIDGRFLVDAEGETAIAVYMMFFGGQKRPMTYRLPGFEPWPDPLPVIRPGEAPPALLHSGGLLHFPDMWHRGMVDAFAAARSAGAMTAIDPQFPLVDTPAPWLEHISDVVGETDVLLCDEVELSMLFDRRDLPAGIAAAHEAGPRMVAVKRGARGSVVSDGRDLIDQPAVPTPEEDIAEAVGAGDAYDAGFLDRLVGGASVAEAARFATAAASLTLRARGGAEGIGSRARVEEALATVPEASTMPAA
jgi:sugar/nucleoside kinase (ribokinase family)